MRKIPTYLVSVFLVITLWRVAVFASEAMGAGWLGWPFALGLGVAVYTCAYFTREHMTIKEGQDEDRRSKNARQAAATSLVIFTLVDGLFNLSEVLRTLPQNSQTVVVIGAWVYGVFPTLAAALLGILQGYVDRLPTPPQRAKTSKVDLLLDLLVQRFEQMLQSPQSVIATPFAPDVPMLQKEIGELRAKCECGWQSARTYETPRGATNALNAHKRKCVGVK